MCSICIITVVAKIIFNVATVVIGMQVYDGIKQYRKKLQGK